MRRWLVGLAVGVGCAGAPPPLGPRPAPAAEPTAEQRVELSPSGTSRRGHALHTVDGLDLVHESRQGALYARPDHHVGSYDAILIDDITLSYRRGRPPLSAEATARLREHLEQSLTAAIREDGLDVKSEPATCTIAMQVHVVDLELLDTGRAQSSATQFITSAGSVMLVLEMRDSLSRAPLVRHGERRTLPGGKLLGSPGALSARGLGDAIDQLLGVVGREMAAHLPPTTARRAVDCEGRLFEAGRVVAH